MQIQFPKELFSDSFLYYLFYVDSLIEIQFGGAGGGKSVHSAFKDILRMIGRPRIESDTFLTEKQVVDIIYKREVDIEYRWVQDEPKNVLILRQTYNTIKDSYFADLKKAIAVFGFEDFFITKTSPQLYIECTETEKVSLFRGLDNVEKLKGVTCKNGSIDHYTVEEITETLEESNNQLGFRTRGGGEYIESDLRGEMFDIFDNCETYEELMSADVKRDIYTILGYHDREDFIESKKSMSGLFNPVNITHWVHPRFFCDSNGKEIFKIQDRIYHTPELFIQHSTHRDNPFLTPEDHRRYMSYKFINQYFYNVYCLGLWGVLGDLIFTKVKPATFDEDFIRNIPEIFIGLDFGTVDPNAIMRVGIDERKKHIYILDEAVQNKLNSEQLIEFVRGFIDHKQDVYCDSAGAQQITDLQCAGINAIPVSKYGGANFKPHGISCIWGYTIFFSTHCKHFAGEVSQYTWAQDSRGNKLNKPVDGNDHTIDAGLFYSLNSKWIRRKTTMIYGA